MNETKDNSGSAEAGNTYIPLFMWDFVEDWEKSIVLLGSEVEGLLVGIWMTELGDNFEGLLTDLCI